jgi:hypothetical protein
MKEHKDFFRKENICPCSENGDSRQCFKPQFCEDCEIWDDVKVDPLTSRVIEE